jgi:hypothetical protein
MLSIADGAHSIARIAHSTASPHGVGHSCASSNRLVQWIRAAATTPVTTAEATALVDLQ